MSEWRCGTVQIQKRKINYVLYRMATRKSLRKNRRKHGITRESELYKKKLQNGLAFRVHGVHGGGGQRPKLQIISQSWEN
jgi:hypothetical protein